MSARWRAVRKRLHALPVLSRPANSQTSSCSTAIIPILRIALADRWLDSWLFTSPVNAVHDVFVAGEHLVRNGRHRERERAEKAYKNVLRRIGDL